MTGRDRRGQTGSVNPGIDSLEDPAERHLGLELAQHAHPADEGAVDEEVLRRQVEPERQLGLRLRRVLEPLRAGTRM